MYNSSRIGRYLFYIFLIIHIVNLKFCSSSQHCFLCFIVLFRDFQFGRKLIIQTHTPYLRLCRLMLCDSYNKIIHWFIIMRCRCLSYHISSIWKWNGYCIAFFIGKDFSCPIFSKYHRSNGIKVISSIFFHS